MTAPVDKYNFVYLTFILHGIGILMPWNMFITAKSYFVEFKLSDSHGDPTIFSRYYMQYVGFCSILPNVLFNWVNIFVNIGSGDLSKRILFSIILLIALFILTIFLAMINTTALLEFFFCMTMLTVIILNMAVGIYQSSLYGVAASLPPNYTGGIILGNNVNGVLVTLVSILFTYTFKSQRTSAIYYFIFALGFLLLCFNSYYALPLSKYFRFNADNTKKQQQLTKSDADTEKVPYWNIFKVALPQLLNVFFLFFASLAVYPAVYSDIKATDSNFFISPEYFTLITCFLIFNFFAMIGSLVTVWFKWPSPEKLWIATVLRLLYIPLFLLCNYHPQGVERKFVVLISNEWIYMIIGITMSFTHGYFTAIAMMYTPQRVEPKYQAKAGMFACAMLISGIFTGILCSFIWPHFVTINT